MGAMAQTNAEAEDRPEPMEYTLPTAMQRITITDSTDKNILTPADTEGMSPQEAIEEAFADYLSGYRTVPSNPDPAPGVKFFHTGWMSSVTAAGAVEHYPELSKYGFYPPNVSTELCSLPSDALVALGREQYRPVIYVFTDRPPMAATLKDAGQNEVITEVVEQFPDDNGKSVLRYDGRPGGEWRIVRAIWHR